VTFTLTHRPAAGRITEPYGYREVLPTPTSPRIHYGTDYGWGGGDTIYAAAGGLVLEYAYSGAYGNRLVIEHGNGHRTWYCHLESCHVQAGDLVSGGQVVAVMGATGNVTAKHLHHELRIGGVAVDSETYYQSGTAAADRSPITNTNRKKDTMLMISAPLPWDPNKRAHAYVPDIGQPSTVSDNVAQVMRQGRAIADFGTWSEFQTEIREAWSRYDTFVGGLSKSIDDLTEETLAQALEALQAPAPAA